MPDLTGLDPRRDYSLSADPDRGQRTRQTCNSFEVDANVSAVHNQKSKRCVSENAAFLFAGK